MARKKSEPAKKEVKAKKPKRESKAGIIKQLGAKGIIPREDSTLEQLKAMLEWKSNLFWLVRLARSTSPFLVSCGIKSKKQVYALPDTEDSQKILNTRRFVILKRTPTLLNEAVIIHSISGGKNGDNN